MKCTTKFLIKHVNKSFALKVFWGFSCSGTILNYFVCFLVKVFHLNTRRSFHRSTSRKLLLMFRKSAFQYRWRVLVTFCFFVLFEVGGLQFHEKSRPSQLVSKVFDFNFKNSRIVFFNFQNNYFLEHLSIATFVQKTVM